MYLTSQAQEHRPTGRHRREALRVTSALEAGPGEALWVCRPPDQGHPAASGCEYPRSSTGAGEFSTTSPWRNYPQKLLSDLEGKNKSCIYPVLLVFVL